jgi:hypothetical protein
MSSTTSSALVGEIVSVVVGLVAVSSMFVLLAGLVLVPLGLLDGWVDLKVME